MTLRQDTPFGQIAAYVEGLEVNGTALYKEVVDLKAQIAEMKDRVIPVPTPEWEVKANTIISIAKALDALRIPYVFGGESREGMDCSGFTQFLFKQVGYSLPRVSDNQSDVGTDVKYEDLRAGDLIFYDFNNDGKITHVSICMGDGKMIHTNTPATGINIQSTSWNYDGIAKIKRILK
jgi:cell wall-associated NlpC family hydrolase